MPKKACSGTHDIEKITEDSRQWGNQNEEQTGFEKRGLISESVFET